MTNWLSDSWKSRMIAGHGQMAIPYIHINCVMSILNKIIDQTNELPNFNIFLASTDRPVSLIELFTLSTRLYYGEAKTPVFIPKFMSKAWVVIRDFIGILVRKRPFERPWMTKYIDKEFPTDCSLTRQTLGWDLKKRYFITHRMLYLIENLKSNPYEWHRKNLARVRRFTEKRPSLTLYEVMHIIHDELVDEVCRVIMLPETHKNLNIVRIWEWSVSNGILTFYIITY